MIHRSALDFYVDRSSPVHRLPATVKSVIAFVMILFTALTPRENWQFLAAIVTVLLLVIPFSRLPILSLLKRLLFLEPFVIGIALLAWFQPNGRFVFASMIAKSTICLLIMILLNSTTSFPSLLSALRAFRIPRLLVTTLALLHRYLFILLDESTRLKLSRKSRTYVRDRVLQRYSFSTMAAQLFIRSSLRAERVYAAMCSRGWKP